MIFSCSTKILHCQSHSYHKAQCEPTDALPTATSPLFRLLSGSWHRGLSPFKRPFKKPWRPQVNEKFYAREHSTAASLCRILKHFLVLSKGNGLDFRHNAYERHSPFCKEIYPIFNISEPHLLEKKRRENRENFMIPNASWCILRQTALRFDADYTAICLKTRDEMGQNPR